MSVEFVCWCLLGIYLFFQGNKSLRWCPAPDCQYAVRVEDGKVDYVRCLCGFRFCFRCGFGEHQPLECDLVKKWLNKCVDDSETAHYLLLNTKVLGSIQQPILNCMSET